ncbi:MAG: proteasome subunit beta [Candidatus Micrarchaeota archaeon]|nr:MAG: proteasome subunit beta [Candidatus Micrarchaeota archaeon]
MEERLKEYLKGTTIIGVVCKDGVIIAADSRASIGSFIASREVRKVHKIDNTVAIAGAGSVGDLVDIVKIIRANNEIYKMNENRPMSPNAVTNLLSLILHDNRYYPYLVELIVGGIEYDGTPKIYSIDLLGGSIEESSFTSAGSGMELAYGYLEKKYKKNISTKDAYNMVLNALSVATRDSGVGDYALIATITKAGYVENREKLKESYDSEI